MKVEAVLAAAEKRIPFQGREKSFRLSPSVRLIHTKTGIKVEVDGVDMAQHLIHVRGHDFWRNVNEYELEIPPTPTPPSPGPKSDVV